MVLVVGLVIGILLKTSNVSSAIFSVPFSLDVAIVKLVVDGDPDESFVGTDASVY